MSRPPSFAKRPELTFVVLPQLLQEYHALHDRLLGMFTLFATLSDIRPFPRLRSSPSKTRSLDKCSRKDGLSPSITSFSRCCHPSFSESSINLSALACWTATRSCTSSASKTSLCVVAWTLTATRADFEIYPTVQRPDLLAMDRQRSRPLSRGSLALVQGSLLILFAAQIIYVVSVAILGDLILPQGWVAGQWVWGTTLYLSALLTVLAKAALISE